MKNLLNLKDLQEKDGVWETLTDFTEFKKDGIDISELLKRLEKTNFKNRP